jgi:N-acetylmuramate 1-kinase
MAIPSFVKQELSSEIISFVKTSLKAQEVEVIQLAGDASSRRYFRIVHNNQSYVLMVWEPFDDNGRYPFLNVLEHFKKHSVNVPDVIAKAPKLGVVLLEDLGDLTLERKFSENQNQKLAVPLYQLAIDEILKIHYPATRDSASNCVAFTVFFNTEKLLWEMNYGREHMLDKLVRVPMTPVERKSLDAIFFNICDTLDKEEKFICHRDYHSRNLMLKFGKMRVIDFQDARMGAVQYDLVSLVHDSYVDMNDETRNEILEYYLTQAKDSNGKAFSRDQFFETFRLQMVQRCFKACGSFASFYNTREDQRYLKYLTPTIHKVAATLEDLPQYSDFLKIIKDNGLLELNYLNPTELKVK